MLKLFLLAVLAGVRAEFELPKRHDAFTNDPVELKPVYHTPNNYEERSYDFWYENWPQPHVHGDQPHFDQRHQHFPGYGDNYDFSNFITDPPTQLAAKSEGVIGETALVDEPTVAGDKVIEKSDKNDGTSKDASPPEGSKADDDLITPVKPTPLKSIDQPKKDYDAPKEPSISGEKLSKPIETIPAESSGDPYSSLSSVKTSATASAYSENDKAASSFVSGYPSSVSDSSASLDSSKTSGPSSSYGSDASSGSDSTYSASQAPPFSVQKPQPPGNPSKSSDVYPDSSNSPSSWQPKSPATDAYSSSNAASIAGKRPEDEYFKSPPGVQPEIYSNPKSSSGDQYGVTEAPYPGSRPTPRVDEFFPEAETEHTVQTLAPAPITESPISGIGGGGEERSSGPRPCCPCCREQPLTPAIAASNAGGCGAPVCGPPPIVGTPPVCCPQAPLQCCPRLPNCCLPQLPCCPRVQLQCCPAIQVCCQPFNFGCRCRSKAVTRLRTKRNGCIPCIGRKKREIEEELHLRQKRLGCIPCLAREKRQAQQNCQSCNPFQQHLVRRVKRTFSCSSCSTQRERVKRQAQIASFYQGNQLGAYRNCKQCYDLPLPARAMKKRSSGFTDGQHDFLARVKRASDGYDPLFQCDSGCCDYEKCLKSKPLRSETFKVPEDSDFISQTGSKDYELPDLKEDKGSGDKRGEELIGSKDALSLGGSEKES